MSRPRLEVQRFAAAMEAKLKKNDHKGGWHDCTRGYLMRRLRTEMREVFDVLAELSRLENLVRPTEKQQRRHDALVAQLLGECADVGNFVMMIADTHCVLTDGHVKEIV